MIPAQQCGTSLVCRLHSIHTTYRLAFASQSLLLTLESTIQSYALNNKPRTKLVLTTRTALHCTALHYTCLTASFPGNLRNLVPESSQSAVRDDADGGSDNQICMKYKYLHQVPVKSLPPTSTLTRFYSLDVLLATRSN